MTRFALVFVTVLAFAICTSAQGNPQTSSLYASPLDASNSQPGAPRGIAPWWPAASSLTLAPFDSNPFASPSTLALSTVAPPAAGPSSAAVSSSTASSAAASAGAPTPDPPQGVYGVRPNYDFQGYLGYTFFRFYELPNITVNTNGFNYSIVYFPHQLKYWVGADGEFVLGLGDQHPYQARFLLGLGGVRVRWAPFSRTNIEIWGHGLAGGTHFTPQTPYGSQDAFAYELGGGVDINTHRLRYAYRIGADLVGTHYFGTYQLSPKISAGFVYKF